MQRQVSGHTRLPFVHMLYDTLLVYDCNRIIRPEAGTEPELRFQLTRTGMTLKNSGSV
jgi:hypothetical protein